jgi:phosphatidylethanolamine N-methyltransferase
MSFVAQALIGLHVWTSLSTYDVLREFGWFYGESDDRALPCRQCTDALVGDFFLTDYPKELLYTGIYRCARSRPRWCPPK